MYHLSVNFALNQTKLLCILYMTVLVLGKYFKIKISGSFVRIVARRLTVDILICVGRLLVVMIVIAPFHIDD